MNVLARYNIMGLGLGLGVATMAQSRNESSATNVMMQQPPQQMQPTQRYDLTQPSMMNAPPNNGMNLLDTSDVSLK